uniref:Cytochrome b n=1 Tax=Plectrocnemia tsukuiensis TaxID=623670 RepID=A0A9E8RTP4_9NEOP|nr:cytochrome b [Plectrocnemia tsukuiensis]UZZ43696.1 cytochrome b [Plectrocnemia tsukuiensis]
MNKKNTITYNENMMKILNNKMMLMPIPSNISFMWNFGSLMGMCMIIQLITGILLSMHYAANINFAFNMMNHIYRNVNYGWMLRILHSNSASMFFIFIYMHIGRNLYYESFQNKMTWNSGIILMFMLMMTAFMGYVLPWGQMSYWGATVITNLISVIPYIGNLIIKWIWGGYSINNATLNRFLSFHFLLPFIMIIMMMIHLIMLHKENSNNPLNINKMIDKIEFYPYFMWKDILTMIMTMMLLIMFSMKFPFILNDYDNFIESNPMITPPHIKPEWYFLFAYAILRSIPNKMGGVIALVMSISILLFMPPIIKNKIILGNNYFFLSKITFWIMVINFILLSWIGQNPVEYPFILMGQSFSILYFIYFINLNWINYSWNLMLN